MTVQDLLDELRECNPDAEVRFVHQPNWPFELSIFGLKIRKNVPLGDAEDEREYDYEEVDDALTCSTDFNGKKQSPDTVLLVEDSQLAYGNKNVWNY